MVLKKRFKLNSTTNIMAPAKKSNKNIGKPRMVNKELIFKEFSQEYATVTKLLGGCTVRVTIYNDDNLDVIAHIPGRFRKKVWINVGDTVLVGIREFEKDRVDIIHKYTIDEFKLLKSYGEIQEKETKDQDGDIDIDIDIEFDIDEI